MSAGRKDEAVAEMAGLHGAFSFPEHLLQRIWLRGDFDQRALRLRDGRKVTLRFRGRWNRLAGPDFSGAELLFGDSETRELVRGAVEVHLRAVDWDRHGHALDPAYDAVVLHVVLFPSMREWTEGAGGRRIPILELLPLLERDLEAYAEDAAVEAIAGRPYSHLREVLGGVTPEKLQAEVRQYASRRWQAKVHIARARIERLGWAEACHQATLEVLGYRPNRVPMLAVAEAWGLARWQAGEVDIEAVYAAQAEGWRINGVRPANHPRVRLAQYARWVGANPDWPEALERLSESWLGDEGGAETVRVHRKMLRLSFKRVELAREVCGGALTGTRLDTWVCDAALPLLAARAAAAGEADLVALYEVHWQAWFPGDAPAELVHLMREFGLAGIRGEPVGQGSLQGLLGWLAVLANPVGRGA
ncbi:MAG: DUF2851 family protein [Verrucomicrobia bacterium]|nr:DUF2851 family protein [Verrucomicrobiota bacterium]